VKRFVVLTSGRAGSTALMESLRRHEDIAVPSRHVECHDEELCHPARVAEIAKAYSSLVGRRLRSTETLVEAFFEHSAGSAYAGFKTMPNRHKDLASLLGGGAIQGIVLLRADIPSTVASFLAAKQFGTWRRAGGDQPHRLPITEELKRDALATTRYLRLAHQQLLELPGVIHLEFERLCEPSFRSPELDAFFARPVALERPRPALSGESYVEAWPEFRAYIERIWNAPAP
jgi:hypothetical protein